MRKRGVDMPDPALEDEGVAIDIDLDLDDPRFREAADECGEETGMDVPGAGVMRARRPGGVG